ncbi:MAG: OmpA family protein [Rickettsiales bacterium]|jgi:outer membrane protein OmpA-like peptidoglycan-associated protein|nr:OmpA family protein [Rickettsiales bacterium]
MKKMLLFLGVAGLFGCAGGGKSAEENMAVPTPTVDYVRHLDPHGGEHKDAFLSQLTMNYRSYAIYNAEVSGFPDIGEMFAQKAVSAFSGETPMPESLDNWNIGNKDELFDLQNACQELIEQLQNDASVEKPRLAAEAQAKFDCWLSSASSGQFGTADECRKRFENALLALKGNGGIIDENKLLESKPEEQPTSGFDEAGDYPETAELAALVDTKRTREGVVVVNNINVPSDLIRPAPVHPVVFNQNIYSNGRVDSGGSGDGPLGSEMVSRDEFINMMMALRNEIQEINGKLADMPKDTGSGIATLKIQQIPIEPKQRIMEEIFEVRFDFDKATVKSEYESVIQKLAATARESKNVKISVVGHTDTVGGANYNYALGGRRAENVKQMLIAQGVPAGSIIVLSSGKNDLKIPTGKNVKNAENRRVRVVKEVRYKERPQMPEPVVEVEMKK